MQSRGSRPIGQPAVVGASGQRLDGEIAIITSHTMLRLLIIVFSIALGDSLNPSTVVPALYLATTEHPRRHLGGFILGVFSVTLLGGLLFMLGPGQLLLALVPQPSATARAVFELLAGAAILGLAAVLWFRRKHFGRRKLPGTTKSGGSGLALGAGIAAIELPTALPYFAALAAITESGYSISVRLAMLVIYNVVFVLPLIAILIVLEVLGENADPFLGRVNESLQRSWPVLLACLGTVIGIAVLALGIAGIS